jgi:alpha-glucosidase
LDVYYKLGKEKSVVYEDAHDGYDYTKDDIVKHSV